MDFKSKEKAPIGRGGIFITDTGKWRKERPIMDKEKCIECGICFMFCPVFSIIKEDEKYEITYDYCKGCGICAHECPKDAIDMVPEEEK